MFKFILKIFITAMTFVGCGVLNVITLKCISMGNQECKLRLVIMNINSNEPFILSLQYSCK